MFPQIPPILFQMYIYVYTHISRSHKRYIRYSADSFLPHVLSRIRGCLARQLSRQIIRVAVVKMLRGI